MLIRPLASEDYDGVFDLLQDTDWSEEANDHLPQPEDINPATVGHYVAVDAQYWGYIDGRITDDIGEDLGQLPPTGPYAYADILTTYDSQHGHGVGPALMHRFVKDMITSGCAYLVCSVRRDDDDVRSARRQRFLEVSCGLISHVDTFDKLIMGGHLGSVDGALHRSAKRAQAAGRTVVAPVPGQTYP